MNHENLIRLPKVMERTGLTRSTIYLYMKQKNFPRPIKLGPRAAAWVESDVDGWINEMISKSRNK